MHFSYIALFYDQLKSDPSLSSLVAVGSRTTEKSSFAPSLKECRSYMKDVVCKVFGPATIEVDVFQKRLGTANAGLLTKNYRQILDVQLVRNVSRSLCQEWNGLCKTSPDPRVDIAGSQGAMNLKICDTCYR